MSNVGLKNWIWCEGQDGDCVHSSPRPRFLSVPWTPTTLSLKWFILIHVHARFPLPWSVNSLKSGNKLYILRPLGSSIYRHWLIDYRFTWGFTWDWQMWMLIWIRLTEVSWPNWRFTSSKIRKGYLSSIPQWFSDMPLRFESTRESSDFIQNCPAHPMRKQAQSRLKYCT